jgi:predicted Fe-S protein YdhL (DUF1289 family)
MSQMTIESPCVDICKLDSQNAFCLGCYRSREEIGEWSFTNDARKREIIVNAQHRADAAID